MKILLAEDDTILGEAIEFGLSQQGHHVDWQQNGLTVADCALTLSFDSIILDIGLPNLSGFEILQKVRAKGITTPIIILTAMDAIEDRVKGLDLGADDYLVKPFDMEELLARLRAISRRDKGRSVNKIKHSNIEIFPDEHLVKVDGETVACSRHEFILLLKLMENLGHVYSQVELEEYLYQLDTDIESNTVQVYIHHLRKKFGKSLIRTIRGVGYVIDENP